MGGVKVKHILGKNMASFYVRLHHLLAGAFDQEASQPLTQLLLSGSGC